MVRSIAMKVMAFLIAQRDPPAVLKLRLTAFDIRALESLLYDLGGEGVPGEVRAYLW